MRTTQSFTRWSASLFLAALVVLFGQAPIAAASDTTWSSVPIDGGGITSLGAGGRGDSLVAWATTASSGVYRSTDAGRTWSLTRRAPSPRALMAGVDPRDGDRAFLMFLTPEGSDVTPSGLFFTTNGGATWKRSMNGLSTHTFVYQVVFDPRDEDALLAAASEGLYRSVDGGRSWSLTGPFTRSVFAIAMAPDDPRLLLVSVLDGVYRSTDGGATFTEVFGSGLPTGLAFDPSDPNRVYGSFGTLYGSTDRGLTWERIGRPFGVNHYFLTVNRDGTLYTGSEVGVVHSTNGGATFLPRANLNRRFPDDSITSLIALPNGDVLASGLRGVWRLDDSATSWRASSRGIQALTIADLTVTGEGRVLVSVPSNGIFFSDDGDSFRASNRGLRKPWGETPGLEFVLSPSDPKIVYGSTGAGFFRSDDGGISWSELNTPSVGQLVRIVAVDPNDPDVVYAGGPEYHPRDDYYKCHSERSRDGGATWTCLQGDDIYALDAVVFDPQRPRRLIALDGNRLVISDDQGDSWRVAGRGLPADQGLNPVLVRDDSGRLFTVSYEGRVYRSVDGGASFAPLGRVLKGEIFVTDLILDPRHPDTLYAAIHGQGIFRSQDGGQTWQRLGTGLPAALFTGRAALDAERGVLYASTRNRGLYRIDVP